MTSESETANRVRNRRIVLGLTQAQVAQQAGVSRTAVTAIEGDRLVPSVAAALAIAGVLQTSVEELFGRAESTAEEVIAWESSWQSRSCWRAEVFGKTVLYPASSAPMLSMLADDHLNQQTKNENVRPAETLVLACCDPAAGIMARHFSAVTGFRLLVIPRSSRQSLELLRAGLVHLAGLHLSTKEDPNRNARSVNETLGKGYQFIRVAQWQDGICTLPTARFRSVRAVKSAKLNWIGREPGSGARQCMDRVLNEQRGPHRIASDHRGVVESIKIGWADAGVCVRLASAEAGLAFLPVQEEFYDICFPTAFAEDRRLKAFLSMVRSPNYQQLIAELPGYDTSESGQQGIFDSLT